MTVTIVAHKKYQVKTAWYFCLSQPDCTTPAKVFTSNNGLWRWRANWHTSPSLLRGNSPWDIATTGLEPVTSRL